PHLPALPPRRDERRARVVRSRSEVDRAAGPGPLALPAPRDRGDPMSRIGTAADRSSERYGANATSFEARLAELRDRRAAAVAGGGAAMTARHRERGKLLVRERIDRLVDPHTPFLELSHLAAWGQYGNEVPGAGIVTGIGRVAGAEWVI